MKKRFKCSILAILIMIVGLTIQPVLFYASAASNPYPTSQTISGVTTVPCTWYAWQQAYDKLGISLPAWGNAKNWYSRAQAAGYAVGDIAQPNSIAVYGETTYGHVAYVVAVNGNKMTVNEGGQMYNGSAVNGNGIVNGATQSSVVGTVKSSGNTLLGFIYLTDPPIVTPPAVSNGYTGSTNEYSDTNAILYGTVTKPASYLAEKFGIRLRKTNGTYENGWSYFHNASSNYSGTGTMKIWFDINGELGVTLTHATSYTYQLYAKINGVEYWGPEGTFTTIGSHSYGAWTTAYSPTCTIGGTKRRTCSCGAYEDAIIPATGHNYSTTYTVDVPSSCTVAGSKSRHCLTCGTKTDVTPIAATGHSWGAYLPLFSATCTQVGEDISKCNNCDSVISRVVNAMGHNYSVQYTVDSPATCVKAGSKSRHCSRCNARTDITTINPSGHTWGQWEEVKKATLEEDGLSKRKCENCTVTEQKTILKLSEDGHAHDFGEAVIVEATCEQMGREERTCSICGQKEITEQAPLGHSFGKWKTVKEATAEEKGEAERECTKCGMKDHIFLPQLEEPADLPSEPADTKVDIEPSDDNEADDQKPNIIPYVIIIAVVMMAVIAISAIIVKVLRNNKK